MSNNMDTDPSEINILLNSSNRTKLTLFFKVYKNTLLLITIPLILLPIAFLGDNNAYICFYAFLITGVYWVFEVLHPAIVSLIPIALSTIMNFLGYEIISFINIRHALLDCFGMLMFLVAIENSHIQKRLALKVLLIFGCSHYRLSFLLFFATMMLSMWVSNTVACGFMIPIVRAILIELEKMGIVEVYETIGKTKQGEQREKHHRIQRPTDFTIFYFLGIAYSSSIGGMATMVGSHANQMFKAYSETLFPLGPKIEFPQFMLLTLPAVLVLETALYLWMNFYFLGLFRIHNYSALHTGSTEEEAQYARTILNNQYQKLGKITTKEIIVSTTVLLCGLLQMTLSSYICNHNDKFFYSHIQVSSPIILCVLLLFILPTNLNCLKFFKKADQNLDPLPTSAGKSCLDWKTVKNELLWDVLLVTGGSCAMFEALQQSGMMLELERLLWLVASWSWLLVLAVVLLCETLTQFGSNVCVTRCMLLHVARVSVASRVNPHFVMLATVLSCSAPFHLITGTPANATVASYVNIPHRRMICAGVGPTIFSIFIIWFTVTIWSKAIWTDINIFPDWANINRNLTILL